MMLYWIKMGKGNQGRRDRECRVTKCEISRLGLENDVN